MKPWMFFWYVFVAISSLLDNVAGVPFTRQFTIRVSRVPTVRISDDAPWVIPEPVPEPPPKSPDLTAQGPLSPNLKTAGNKAPASQDDITVMTRQLTASNVSTTDASGFNTPKSHRYTAISQYPRQTEILGGLKRGYNTVGRVVMDHNEPWAAQNNPFYVIISIRGIDNNHAALRVFSKFLSIGVFTVGTGMFASTAFVTILVAVIVSSLILVAGVFGRVTAMWMASELMQNK